MKTDTDKYVDLDKLGKVSRGRSQHRPRNASHLYGGKYPFIQTADVTRSSLYITNYIQTYSESGLSQSRLWDENTLCIVNAGVNTGDNAILKFKACFPDSIIGFRASPNRCEVRFVKYYLDSIKTQIRTITMGATQDNLSVSKLLTFKIPKISLENQRKIAAILSAYDDLIENNKRRIALLEKMAEEIYREWFVRMRFPGHEKVKLKKGVPDTWRIVSLDDIAKINKSALKKSNPPSSINYIDISSVTTNRLNGIKQYLYSDAPGRARRIVKHGDILWSSVRPANKAYCLILDPIENLIASTGFAVITPNEDMPYSYLYFAVTSDSYIDYISTVAKGSAYPATSIDDFQKSKVLLPLTELLKKFHEICGPMFSQIKSLDSKNELLKNTRDMLLGRLISGKLPVDHLDIHFPPSMHPQEDEVHA